MKRVNFKIDEREKEKIAAYVEENSKFENLSNLSRVLTLKEVEGDDQQVAEVPPELYERISSVEGELEEIKQGLDNLASNLEDESQDIEVIAQEVYNTIPNAPAANSAEIAATGRSAQSLETQHARTAIDLEGPSAVEELAKHLGEDREDIKVAIRHLKSNFLPSIEIVDEDGKKHYLKQEERR